MRVKLVKKGNNVHIIGNVDSVRLSAITQNLLIHSFMLPTYDECVNVIPMNQIEEFEVIDGKEDDKK